MKKHRNGRPRKPQEFYKSERITFSVTPSDLEKIINNAYKEGREVADYCRTKILNNIKIETQLHGL